MSGSRPFVSIATDFGAAYTSICAGVVHTIAPEANVLVLSDEITPFDVVEGAMLLRQALPYLPVGVHTGIVDPGVGTPRRPLAVETGRGDVPRPPHRVGGRVRRDASPQECIEGVCASFRRMEGGDTAFLQHAQGLRRVRREKGHQRLAGAAARLDDRLHGERRVKLGRASHHCHHCIAPRCRQKMRQHTQELRGCGRQREIDHGGGLDAEALQLEREDGLLAGRDGLDAPQAEVVHHHCGASSAPCRS